MTTSTLAPPVTNRIMEVALIYATLGWPVFPCKPMGKTPITANGFKDASTDPDQIKIWWTQNPDANVAIATGIAFDVLDIDGDEGFANLGLALVDSGDEDSDSLDGPTVLTGKGAHVYFAPTGLGNRAGVVPNVDWRGAGGYVIAAPSVHPNGTIYKFQHGSNDPLLGVNAPLPAAPPWLRSLVGPKPVQQRTASSTSGTKNVSAYGQQALNAECGLVAMAPEGQRNHQLNSSAFSLGQLVSGGVLDIDNVIDQLRVCASRAGLEDGESQRTIASGLQSGMLSPRRPE